MSKEHFFSSLTHITIFLVILICWSTKLPVTASPNDWPMLETLHFVVRVEPTPYEIQAVSLREWGEMLEQYFVQLENKIKPILVNHNGSIERNGNPFLQKTQIFLCATFSSYHLRLAEHGLKPSQVMGGSGGFYYKSENMIFVFQQPTQYYTRHVMLHEATHWYCHQLLKTGLEKIPLWLNEGMADHCAFHTWDGKNLHAVELPCVSLENYPGRLKTLLDRFASFDSETSIDDETLITPASIAKLSDMISRDITAPSGNQNDMSNHDYYAVMWGVTSFLLERYPSETKRFIANCAVNDHETSWQKASQPLAENEQPKWRDLLTWVEAKQLPWEWVWNYWEDDGKTLTGVSDTTALIVQNVRRPDISPEVPSETLSETLLSEASPRALSDTISLSVRVKPLLSGTVFGIATQYENDGAFEAIQFCDLTPTMARWRHVRYADKKWETLTRWQKIAFADMANTSETETALDITCRRSNGHISLMINDNATPALTVHQASPTSEQRFGILVQTGAAQFWIAPNKPSTDQQHQ